MHIHSMRTIYRTLCAHDYFDLLYQNDDDLLDRIAFIEI